MLLELIWNKNYFTASKGGADFKYCKNVLANIL